MSSPAAPAPIQLTHAKERLREHEAVRDVTHAESNWIVDHDALSVLLSGDRVPPVVCRIIWESSLEIRAFERQSGGEYSELLLA